MFTDHFLLFFLFHVIHVFALRVGRTRLALHEPLLVFGRQLRPIDLIVSLSICR